MFKAIYKSFLTVLLVLIMSVSVSFGQNTDVAQFASQASILDTVVVTSSRTAEELREITTNITILDEETIKNSSASDIGDLLIQQGFQVSGYPAGGKALVIRGMGQNQSGTELTQRVLVLLNGRRTFVSSMDFTGLANVKRIEIIRGPASLQYGPQAMGGVINVITKNDTDKIRGYAEVGVGSFSLHKEKAAFSGKVGDFDFSLGFLHKKANDYKTGKGFKWDHSAPGDSTNVNLNIGYTFLTNHRFGIDYYLLDVNNAECPVFEVSHYNPQPGNTGFTVHDNRISNIGFYYDGHTDDNLFNWSFTYGTGRNKDKSFGLSTGGYSWNGIELYDMNTFTSIFSYNGSLISAVFGLDYVKYQNKSVATNNDKLTDLGFFISSKIHLLDNNLIISLGGRTDRYKLETNQANNFNQNKTNFVPSVGIAYTPLNWLKLRANYAEGFVMPTLVNFVGNTTYRPNYGLKPEQSKTYEVGIDIFWEYINASLTYFHTNWADKLVGVDTGEVNPNNTWAPGTHWYRMENLDGAVIAGYEFAFSADLGQAFNKDFVLKPYISFTYMPTRRNKDHKGGPQSVETLGFDTLTNVAKSTWSFGVSFVEPNIHLTSNINAHTARGTISQNYGDDLRWVKYGNALLVDFMVEKRIIDWREKGHLNLKLEINNIFDGYDEGYINYPGPGRNFYVGMAYEY
jgi:vitamin B12 transporter